MTMCRKSKLSIECTAGCVSIICLMPLLSRFLIRELRFKKEKFYPDKCIKNVVRDDT